MDDLLITQILSFVEKVGAPYVLCFLLWRNSVKRDKYFVQAINKMTRALNDLVNKITALENTIEEDY